MLSSQNSSCLECQQCRPSKNTTAYFQDVVILEMDCGFMGNVLPPPPPTSTTHHLHSKKYSIVVLPSYHNVQLETRAGLPSANGGHRPQTLNLERQDLAGSRHVRGKIRFAPSTSSPPTRTRPHPSLIFLGQIREYPLGLASVDPSPMQNSVLAPDLPIKLPQ